MAENEYDIAAKAGSTLFQLEDNFRKQVEYERSRDDAIFQTAELLRKLNETMENERLVQASARKKAEQEQALALEEQQKAKEKDSWRFVITTIIGGLTLAATVLFGILGLLR